MTRPSGFNDVTCGALALVVRPFFVRHFKTALVALLVAFAWMVLDNNPNLPSFALVMIGGLLPCYIWTTSENPGLPITPIIGLQTVVFYGTPLLVKNPAVMHYGAAAVDAVAFDIFLFGLAVVTGWKMATLNRRTPRPRPFHRFVFLDSENPTRRSVLGLSLLAGSVAFLVANQLRYTAMIPGGLYPVVRAVADAAGIGGGLLGGYFVATGVIRGNFRASYWLLLFIHCLLTTFNYTLFPATGLLTASLIGVFLGRGKIPLLPIVVIALSFAFLNLSKFEMRKRYWLEGFAYAPQELADLPDRFGEWAELSWLALTTPDEADGDNKRATQRLSDRVNNFVNILEARDAMVNGGVAPFGGGTYTVIPLLLIPRFLWSDKPRTHEGMVALNVHFGRQSREDSIVTYISWGLLPEAYANFGPLFGALFIGLALGALAGAVEFWGRTFPFTSLEALLVLSLTVQLGTSFEMVASLWITSMFQMIIALTVGTFYFVRKTRPVTPLAS
jgi:hypothetical protein